MAGAGRVKGAEGGMQGVTQGGEESGKKGR